MLAVANHSKAAQHVLALPTTLLQKGQPLPSLLMLFLHGLSAGPAGAGLWKAHALGCGHRPCLPSPGSAGWWCFTLQQPISPALEIICCANMSQGRSLPGRTAEMNNRWGCSGKGMFLNKSLQKYLFYEWRLMSFNLLWKRKWNNIALGNCFRLVCCDRCLMNSNLELV